MGEITRHVKIRSDLNRELVRTGRAESIINKALEEYFEKYSCKLCGSLKVNPKDQCFTCKLRNE